MAHSPNERLVHEEIERCAAAALSREIPLDVVSAARRHTARALSSVGDTNKRRLSIRVRRYFDAVVSGRLVRARGAGRATARLVLEAAVAELSSSGRSSAEVWEQIQRGWGDQVPSDVLDECRSRLCA